MRTGRAGRAARLAAAFACLASRDLRAGGFSLFLPRPVDNGAYVEFFPSYEKENERMARTGERWSDLFLKEKVTVFSNGYVYHPRFLEYRLSVTEGLKQETYESTVGPLYERRNARSTEYDAHVTLLPEHPYSFELFATRSEPLLREQYAIQHDSLSSSRGAEVRYRRKPLMLRARYSDDEIDAGDVASNVRTLALEAGYIKEYGGEKRFTLNAAAAPARFSSSSGIAGHSTSSWAESTLDLGTFRETSNVSSTDLAQSGGGALDTSARQLLVLEQAHAEIAPHLLADLSLRFQDARSDLPGAPDPESRRLTSTRYDGELDLRHQLYQSLQSVYSLSYDSGQSNTGDNSALANALSLAYTKLIPGGRVVAGLRGSLGETGNTGRSAVIGETHTGVGVPGVFALDRPNADAGTLVVLVRSPQAPFELVQLVEGAEYSTVVVAGTIQVNVLALPAGFVLPGKYEFRVTYALEAGSFRLRTEMLGQNGSVELLHSLVTPYYSYSVVRSTVLSGAAPGGGLNSRVFTAGISSVVASLRARVEYQDVFWESGPYRGVRAELQYGGFLTRTTNVNASLSYQSRRFDATVYHDAYGETVASGSLAVQQFLFSHTMSISAGGGYSSLAGLDRSRSFSLNGSLSWRVGLLDASAGATYYEAETENGTILSGRREHGYYYLRLRRQVF